MKLIRNFGIIAHIDHGKSTLADRMLELTGTVPKREMKEQLLDSMELERERGITIKMQPVRMMWKGVELNLIDTPGHIDFSYEVSRALKAVEGVILLVDATQGIQAQTLSVLAMARNENLSLIPVISKIDSPRARTEEVKNEISKLLNCEPDTILEVSGKTGEGVEKLLDAVVERVPAPLPLEEGKGEGLQALIFDFKYSTHRGVIVFVRLFSGQVKAGDNLLFKVADHSFNAIEVGTFSPKEKPTDKLEAGEIGYIVTGIKSAGVAFVGDTIAKKNEAAPALPGYSVPMPVVWASIYPESQDDFNELKQALLRLKLTDSSLLFEEESSGVLGKGFRTGFLGMLHLEIVSERLKREFNLELIITSPSIIYDVVYKTGKQERIYSPSFFPDDGLVQEVNEPMARIKIITPSEYISEILKILYDHEAVIDVTDNFGDDRTVIECNLPLRELMRNFFDQLKSGSKGYASLSYEITGAASANVTRLDLLINDEVEPAFSRVVSKRIVESEAEKIVEKLYNKLGRQMITVKIQGRAMGRIISSKTLSALRKDVTQHMYGGDITRKMKLREKQKKGKKKMQERGSVRIPQDVFMKMIKPE
jgi:GTP-binding protein LepA